MDKKHARQKAEERVNELKGFYRHLVVYTVVNSILLIINLVNNPDYLWFYWPLLGWGFGLVSHAFKVSELTPHLFKNWEEKKIEQLTEQYQEEEKTNTIK